MVLQGRSQVVLCAGVVRVRGDDLAIMRFRVLMVPKALQGDAEIEVRVDVVRLDRQRLLNGLDAAVGLALLQITQAEEMQRDGMLWG